MDLIKRISGNLKLVSVGATDNMLIATNELTIDGNLTVTGTTTTVDSEDTLITDNTITLNHGETGSGVTLGVAGIEIDRGTEALVKLRFNEAEPFNGSPGWEYTNDGTVYHPLFDDTAFQLINDPDPHLGGDLITNYAGAPDYKITSADNESVIIDAHGTGVIKFDTELALFEAANISSVPDYNIVYANVPGDGGSGLFVRNSTIDDELISREKALIYGILF